jgi:hypothetical protein
MPNDRRDKLANSALDYAEKALDEFEKHGRITPLYTHLMGFAQFYATLAAAHSNDLDTAVTVQGVQTFLEKFDEEDDLRP